MAIVSFELDDVIKQKADEIYKDKGGLENVLKVSVMATVAALATGIIPMATPDMIEFQNRVMERARNLEKEEQTRDHSN